MEFNSRGQTAAGIGDGIISLDNEPITRGSSAAWYDDDNIVFQRLDDGFARVSLYNIHDKSYNTEYNAPAGTVMGGGGTWAAFLANPITFVTSIGHFVNNESGLVAVGAEGQVCYKPLYQSAGPYRIRQKNGVDWLLSSADITDVQLIRNGEAIWRQGNQLFSIGLPTPIQLWNAGNIWRPRVAFNNGEWYISYMSEQLNGLVAHKLLDKSKFKLFPGSNYFNHNLCSVNNVIIIGWASSEGEQPGQITVQPIIQFGDSEPIPTPVGETKMIRAFERTFWQAPYLSHHKRYGDTSPERHVGNSIHVDWEDDNLGRFLSLGKGLIFDIDNALGFTVVEGLVVTWYCSANNLNDLGAKVERAKTFPERPIIAYLDSRDWPANRPDWLTTNVWPSIQAYPAASEPLNNFIMNIESLIQRVDSYEQPMCLASRTSEGNADYAYILQCVPFYEEWLRNFFFVAHMPFSDRRGNGIQKNENLWQAMRAFQYAIPFGQPNRFDYWIPEDASMLERLENKFGQSRASFVIEQDLQEDILDKYEDDTDPGNGSGGDEEPDIDEPLLRVMLEHAWDKYGGGPGGGNPIRGKILNEAAFNYNEEVGEEHVGLSRKEFGSHVIQPHTGELIAHDIIQVKPPQDTIFSTMYDCFNDTGVILGESEQHNDASRIWIAPVRP